MATLDSSWQESRSKENLKAGTTLMAEGLFNAAASRFYYALYHAVWRLLAIDGEDPRDLPSRREGDDTIDSWPHKHLLSNIGMIVASIRKPLAKHHFGQRLHDNYKRFFNYRVHADYKKAPVDPTMLKAHYLELEKLVKDLLSP